MKYSVIFTTIISLAVSSQLVFAGEITDPAYGVGDPLTAEIMNNIRTAVNDNDGNISTNTTNIGFNISDISGHETRINDLETFPSFTPRTGYISVAPHAFQPEKNGYIYHYDGWSLINDGGVGSARYYAPVYLPHEATILSLTIRYVDTSASDITVRLCKHTNGNSINCVFLVAASSDTTTGWRTTTQSCTSSCTVENSASDYYLDLTLPDVTMRFAGANIEYQYTTP